MNEAEMQQYTAHRSQLEAGLLDSYTQFDKAILLLAGGTIIVSLTVIKDVVPLVTARHINYIVFSWMALVSSLISILISFITSQISFRVQIKNLDEYFLKDKESSHDKKNLWSKITTILNSFSFILYFSGTVSLLVFVFKNLNAGEC
jgi:hypothetical protein